MSDEHRDTGVGWPEERSTAAGPPPAKRPATAAGPGSAPARPTPGLAEPAGPASAPAEPGSAPAEPAGSAPDVAPERAAAPRPRPEADGLSEVDDVARDGTDDGSPAAAEPASPAADGAPERNRRRSGAGVMIGVLLALLGFAIAVQFKNVSTDPTLAAARQEDLVRILSDLEAREQRLRADIAGLEESQRQLNSGAQGRQAALEEARRRADDLGILAGTLPARGPGLFVRFDGPPDAVKASAILDAVQELRGAGGEVMQIAGGDAKGVRIVASTYFLDAEGGINVDGRLVTGPYTLRVIGDPETMRTALHIAGGVAESVAKDGGTVTDEQVAVVEVDALREPSAMQYARPVS